MASGVLRKKKVFTLCRPIPGFIPRQLALDVLHNHSEVITLNPLVIDHHSIKPPPHAASDEYSCTWYEITERIQYIPGIGQMGSGKISFTGCFHDMPWGLQTHMYAPMSVDLRAQYRVAGNQVGVEPESPRELGLTALGAPAEGLYLRTDIEFSSNVALAGFVRTQLKAAIKEMVDRMVKRAERLDADVLQGMIDEEKTSTVHPAIHTYELQTGQHGPAAMRHSFSNTSEPTSAMELPGSLIDSQPGNYLSPQSSNYLSPQTSNYSTPNSSLYSTPQSGSYMAPAGNMRPQGMIDEEKMSTAHPAVHSSELQPGQRDRSAMRHSFSSTSKPTDAIALPDSCVDSQPGRGYNSQPGNYLNPQPGSYTSPARNMRPQSMTSLPNR